MDMAAARKNGRRLVGKNLLYAISVFASFGVFLFGYDQGVMSGIITGGPYFINYFHRPRAIAVGSMVVVLEIGLSSRLWRQGGSDIIGRKGTLFTGAVIFTLGGAFKHPLMDSIP